MNKRLLLLASLAMMFTACSESDDENTNDTQPCVNDSRQCSEDGIPEICISGSWVKQTACDASKKCLSGNCVDLVECNDNTKQCSRDGVPEICSSGKWIKQPACDATKKCLWGDCVDQDTKECSDGAKHCNLDGVPELCVSGSWVKQDECNSDQKCFKGECVDQDTKECGDGAKQCDEYGVPELCESGSWVKQNGCGTTEKCLAGDCVAQDTKECDLGAQKCSDQGLPQYCAVDTWTDLGACDEDEHCVDGYCLPNGTHECRTNAKRCNPDGVPEVCEDEVWVKQASCNKNEKCLDADCVLDSAPECSGTDRQCSVGGLPQICQDQKWVSLKACGDDEFCNPKSGECKQYAACDETQCRLMSADEYMGNICVETGFGTTCGCDSDKDCYQGYTCNLTVGICSKPDPQTKPSYTSGVCLGHAGSYTCDGDYAVACSADSAEVYREYCPHLTGGAYMGETCVTNPKDKIATCGCRNNSDCKSGYECNSDYYCTKKECSDKECENTRGSKYIGDVCVDSYIEGVKDCGCKSDNDCKKGFKCDTTLLRCLEEAPEVPKSICNDKPNGSVLCQNNDIIYCENGNESTRKACKNETKYSGNACLDSLGRCGCKNKFDCEKGYTCSSDHYCTQPLCIDVECKIKSGTSYFGDICIQDSSGIERCGCKSKSDCKAGYDCNTTFGLCYAAASEGNKSICDGIKDGSTICSGNDVVLCKNGAESSRTTCAQTSGSSYYGDICTNNFCGCNSNSNCKSGYICTNHKCEVKKCSDSECKNKAESEYQGNVCVYGEGTDVCGCTKDSECKTDFECDTQTLKCVKKSPVVPEPNVCDGVTGNTNICDGKDLVSCAGGKESSRKSCKSMSDPYLGNACLENTCGCSANSDCSAGYECQKNKCEKVKCFEPECKAAIGDDYLGNVCVDVFGEQGCGCNTNADCKTGYECNKVVGLCAKTNGSSGICAGKEDDDHVCDGDYVAYCRDERVEVRYACAVNGVPDETYLGNICLADAKICGCNKNSDCASYYICNSEHVCIKKCSEQKCETKGNQHQKSYKGNACIDVPYGNTDEKECGCLTDSDCVYGYVCDSSSRSCVESNCRAASCKSRTSNYAGDICVKNRTGEDPWGCGCLTDSDCREGYECSLNTMTCSKLPEQVTNICASKDGKYICDGNARVYCKNEQQFGDAAPCNLVTGAAYTGNICIADTGECGCESNADCKEGFECKNKVCQKEAVNPCKGLTNTTVCDGNELVYCGSGSELKRESCSQNPITGTLCTQTKPDNQYACGCKSDSDCRSVFKCGSSMKCISSSFEIQRPERLTCEYIKKASKLLDSCENISTGKYKLKDIYETEIELYVDANKQRQFNVSQTGKHYIKFTNLRPSAKASIVWGFENNLKQDRENNYLKVSDGSNAQLYKATNSGDNRIEFTLGSSSKTLIIEHAGSGSESLYITSIIGM